MFRIRVVIRVHVRVRLHFKYWSCFFYLLRIRIRIGIRSLCTVTSCNSDVLFKIAPVCACIRFEPNFLISEYFSYSDRNLLLQKRELLVEWRRRRGASCWARACCSGTRLSSPPAWRPWPGAQLPFWTLPARHQLLQRLIIFWTESARH